ncbi:hypothetical protein GW17_00017715 [Ensete ventricosum]|nr:hypothetical protein GW17_00017715 [Ensete ventricosum]
MSSAARPSGACLKCLLVVFAVASALCVSGPALYWRFKKGFASTQSLSSSSHPGCAPCVCDCPPPLSLDAIAPGDLSFLLPFLFLSRIVHFLGSYYEFLMLPVAESLCYRRNLVFFSPCGLEASVMLLRLLLPTRMRRSRRRRRGDMRPMSDERGRRGPRCRRISRFFLFFSPSSFSLG